MGGGLHETAKDMRIQRELAQNQHTKSLFKHVCTKLIMSTKSGVVRAVVAFILDKTSTQILYSHSYFKRKHL